MYWYRMRETTDKASFVTHRPVDKNTKKPRRTCDPILLDDYFLVELKVSVPVCPAPGLAIHGVDLSTDDSVRLI